MNRKIWAAAIGGLLTVGALSGCADDAEVAAPETVAVEDEAAPTTEPEAATETPAPPTVEAVTETVTEEVTVEVPAPETEVTEEGIGEGIGDMSDEEINELALQMVWDAMSASEQADICFGWGLDKDMMIDAFLEGSGDSYSRGFVSDFFDGEC